MIFSVLPSCWIWKNLITANSHYMKPTFVSEEMIDWSFLLVEFLEMVNGIFIQSYSLICWIMQSKTYEADLMCSCWCPGLLRDGPGCSSPISGYKRVALFTLSMYGLDYSCPSSVLEDNLVLGRIPIVMESLGKSWKNLWSWKVMENSKNIKIMEK